MAEPQSLSNHTRLDPLFHLFVLPVFAASLIMTIVHVVRRPSFHSAWLVVLMLAVMVAAFKIRLYALKVQDRVTRLEERLRLERLLDASMLPQIGDLTEAQLIGLRFASDAELPALVARALSEKLSTKEIKKAIRKWRPDYFRI